MIGLVWRNFRCCKNERVLGTLYCSLIRPRLEYCTLVFNSISQSQSDRLERLQRRYNQGDVTYLEMCKLFSLPTLAQRRKVNDCLFLYKHIHSKYNLTTANPFSFHVPERCTRSASKHIMHVPMSRVDVTKKGLFPEFHLHTTSFMNHAMCLGLKH